MAIQHKMKPGAALPWPSRPSTKYFIFVQHEQSNALNDLCNFVVLPYSETHDKNKNHYSHITT